MIPKLWEDWGILSWGGGGIGAECAATGFLELEQGLGRSRSLKGRIEKTLGRPQDLRVLDPRVWV